MATTRWDTCSRISGEAAGRRRSPVLPGGARSYAAAASIGERPLGHTCSRSTTSGFLLWARCWLIVASRKPSRTCAKALDGRRIDGTPRRWASSTTLSLDHARMGHLLEDQGKLDEARRSVLPGGTARARRRSLQSDDDQLNAEVSLLGTWAGSCATPVSGPLAECGADWFSESDPSPRARAMGMSADFTGALPRRKQPRSRSRAHSKARRRSGHFADRGAERAVCCVASARHQRPHSVRLVSCSEAEAASEYLPPDRAASRHALRGVAQQARRWPTRGVKRGPLQVLDEAMYANAAHEGRGEVEDLPTQCARRRVQAAERDPKQLNERVQRLTTQAQGCRRPRQ